MWASERRSLRVIQELVDAINHKLRQRTHPVDPAHPEFQALSQALEQECSRLAKLWSEGITT
jgi:hypothetical protein